MKTKIKINQILTPMNSLFSHMNYDFKIIEKSQLDLLFFTHYGEKTISPIVDYYVKEEKISDENMSELVDIIVNYYKNNWDKLFSILEIDYDPIHNFSDTLKEEIKDTDDKITTYKDELIQTGNGSKKRTDNLKSVDTKDLNENTTGDITDKMEGYNSTTFKDRDQENTDMNVKTTGTDTIENSGTQIIDEIRNFTDDKEGKDVIDDDYTRNREVTRSGNIGNITSQQMITQEIDLWKWNIIKSILEDVRDFTTIQVYI